MTKKWLTLVSAYGRDYQTEEQVFNDWTKPKDFRIEDISSLYNGKYISSNTSELYPELKNYVFKIRYNKKADFCLIEMVDGAWIIRKDDDG